MGSGGGGSPQLIQPGPAAQTQNQYNIEAGEASQAGSMVNQVNPSGTLNYTQRGTQAIQGPDGQTFNVPQYTSTLTLNPTQQELLNVLNQTKTNTGIAGADLFARSDYSNPIKSIGDMSSGLTGQLMSGWEKSQFPWMEQSITQLDTQLRNQGLDPSSTANSDPSTWGPYEKAMNQLQQSQQMAVAGAASQFEPQAFAQASSLYETPLQISENLASFGSPNNLNSSLINPPGATYQPPDYLGAVNNYNQQQTQIWEQQQAQQAAMTQGLFGIGSSLVGGLFGGV